MILHRHTLVLGGAKSGKSRFAEALCRESGLDRLYMATAQAFDDEMKTRIARHRADRADDGWTTVEEPLALPEMLEARARDGQVILVDCLTLWVTNLLMAEWDIAAETGKLVDLLEETPGACVFVSNEVGLGIVPDNKLARVFRDEAGLLHQALAARCDRVVTVTAGLPLYLKGAS